MYQGLRGAEIRALVDRLHAMMIGREPDLTLLIDIDPAAGLDRARRRQGGEDRFESFGPELQRRLRQGFLELADACPDRVRTVDGSGPADRVAADIRATLAAWLP
jgi:dTMP kinase